MSKISTIAMQQNRLERLDRIARRLDSNFRIPVLGVRFGWDSVFGLIPGFGDLATAVPGVFMIYEGVQMGARRRVLARMGVNTAVDLLVGSIPLAGDLFDLFFKSHRRNIALLKAEVACRNKQYGSAGKDGPRGEAG
ncbi:DUF4112 domain-containing protein [Roseobacter weihaiensis]|uniref:DUF4112 domain-containing protein n=1 Tax=Roseobacter weihaiensis TaxID=2763262 RepID=UPI001D0AA7DD|nr:DUF4112 domain-containing protein [Roseobacter sp. H9]